MAVCVVCPNVLEIIEADTNGLLVVSLVVVLNGVAFKLIVDTDLDDVVLELIVDTYLDGVIFEHIVDTDLNDIVLKCIDDKDLDGVVLTLVVDTDFEDVGFVLVFDTYLECVVLEFIVDTYLDVITEFKCRVAEVKSFVLVAVEVFGVVMFVGTNFDNGVIVLPCIVPLIVDISVVFCAVCVKDPVALCVMLVTSFFVFGSKVVDMIDDEVTIGVVFEAVWLVLAVDIDV